MAKFLLTLPKQLRDEIKREANKHGVSMNVFIVTVVEQFVKMQREGNAIAKRKD